MELNSFLKPGAQPGLVHMLEVFLKFLESYDPECDDDTFERFCQQMEEGWISLEENGNIDVSAFLTWLVNDEKYSYDLTGELADIHEKYQQEKQRLQAEEQKRLEAEQAALHQKQIEELKRAEELKKIEEERKKVEEEKRIAEEKRKLEEERKKLAEEKRLLEEMKAEEARRLAESQKQEYQKHYDELDDDDAAGIVSGKPVNILIVIMCVFVFCLLIGAIYMLLFQKPDVQSLPQIDENDSDSETVLFLEEQDPPSETIVEQETAAETETLGTADETAAAPTEPETTAVTETQPPATEASFVETVQETVPAVRYSVISGKYTWDEAKRLCESYEGQLASIHSEEDWTAVLDAVAEARNSNSDLKYFWLGAFSEKTDGGYRFRWTDDSETDYLMSCNHWYPNEPSYYDYEEDVREPYLLLWYVKSAWSLNDVPDVSQHPNYKTNNMGLIIQYPTVPAENDIAAAEVPAAPYEEPEPDPAPVTQPVFTSVSASSTLAPIKTSKRTYYYDAANVLDGSIRTSWTEGDSSDGIGETLTFRADSAQHIRQISIYNGICENENDFYNNNRIKELSVIWNTGEYTVELSDGFDAQPCIFALPEAVDTDVVTFRIESIFPGNKYQDTAITSITFLADE